MTWTPPPPARLLVKGEYQGNNYPEDAEYEVTVVAEGEDEWSITTCTSAGVEIDRMVLGADDARHLRSCAVGHQKWPVPGLQVEPAWHLALDEPSHYVALNAGHLDEISGWLEFWSGGHWDPTQKEWDDG